MIFLSYVAVFTAGLVATQAVIEARQNKKRAARFSALLMLANLACAVLLQL